LLDHVTANAQTNDQLLDLAAAIMDDEATADLLSTTVNVYGELVHVMLNCVIEHGLVLYYMSAQKYAEGGGFASPLAIDRILTELFGSERDCSELPSHAHYGRIQQFLIIAGKLN
jgi:hypothetical protein